MNKAEIETIKYVIQEHCPPTDLVVKAALKSLADYAVTGAQQLVIHAKFETEGGGAVGSTDAPVKRTEHNDDGSFTVVIDHWPVAQQPQEIEVQCPVCNHKFYEWPNDKQPQAEAVPTDVVRDAERYRWLFSSHTEAELAECDQKSLQPPHTKQDETLALLGGWYTTKEQADKAIDAAIAQQKGASHE